MKIGEKKKRFQNIKARLRKREQLRDGGGAWKMVGRKLGNVLSERGKCSLRVRW